MKKHSLTILLAFLLVSAMAQNSQQFIVYPGKIAKSGIPLHFTDVSTGQENSLRKWTFKNSGQQPAQYGGHIPVFSKIFDNPGAEPKLVTATLEIDGNQTGLPQSLIILPGDGSSTVSDISMPAPAGRLEIPLQAVSGQCAWFIGTNNDHTVEYDPGRNLMVMDYPQNSSGAPFTDYLMIYDNNTATTPVQTIAVSQLETAPVTDSYPELSFGNQVNVSVPAGHMAVVEINPVANQNGFSSHIGKKFSLDIARLSGAADYQVEMLRIAAQSKDNKMLLYSKHDISAGNKKLTIKDDEENEDYGIEEIYAIITMAGAGESGTFSVGLGENSFNDHQLDVYVKNVIASSPGKKTVTLAFTCEGWPEKVEWNFGDGNISVADAPTKEFDEERTYHVSLEADFGTETVVLNTQIVVNK